MVNELLSCEDSATYRTAMLAEARGWWDNDFDGVRLTDAAAFAAVEMAIAERAAVVGATAQITTYSYAGEFFSITRPVVERLRAMRDKIMELAALFANLDPGTDEFYNGYVNSIPHWTQDDISRSEHPMSGIPAAGELDQSADQNARIASFLSDCKYWLLKLRLVDATDLAWYSRRHQVDASHSAWVDEGLPEQNIPASGYESVNGVEQSQPSSVSSRLSSAVAGATTSSDDAPGAGDSAQWPASSSVSEYRIYRNECAASDHYLYNGSWVSYWRSINEDGDATVYSGLNVRNPAPISAVAVVLLVPKYRPSTDVDELSFSIDEESGTSGGTNYVRRSREFTGRNVTESALYNGSEKQTLSWSWDSSGDVTETRVYFRPDGTAYRTETTTITGVGTWTAGYAKDVEVRRLLELAGLAPTSGVVVAGGATALGVIPALSSLPMPSDASPVPLPSMSKNSLNDYSLDICYSVRARVLLDYGDYYTF